MSEDGSAKNLLENEGELGSETCSRPWETSGWEERLAPAFDLLIPEPRGQWKGIEPNLKGMSKGSRQKRTAVFGNSQCLCRVKADKGMVAQCLYSAIWRL
jgi:hypothetical protein